MYLEGKLHLVIKMPENGKNKVFRGKKAPNIKWGPTNVFRGFEAKRNVLFRFVEDKRRGETYYYCFQLF